MNNLTTNYYTHFDLDDMRVGINQLEEYRISKSKYPFLDSLPLCTSYWLASMQGEPLFMGISGFSYKKTVTTMLPIHGFLGLFLVNFE